MKIILQGPTSIRLEGDYERIVAWRDSVAVKVPGAEFSNAFKKGWDGMSRPGRLRKVEGRWGLDMARGFLRPVAEAFPDSEIDPVHRPGPGLNVGRGMDDRHYDHQEEALKAAAEYRWGLIAYATNAGKGAVMGAIVRAATDYRTIVLADEVSVFEALEEELAEWGTGPPALVKAGVKEPPDGDVVLAMVPTLSGRVSGRGAGPWRDWCASFGIALADEADRATAKRWKKVLSACDRTEFRLGFSGTFPTFGEETDGEAALKALELTELFGPRLADVRNMEMVEKGISARPVVELTPYRTHLPPKPHGWRDLTGPERRAWVYEQAVHLNRERNDLVRKLTDGAGPAAVIVEAVAHGHALAEVIPHSRFVHGTAEDDCGGECSTTEAEREDALDGFARGDFAVLIATRLLDRGSNRLGHAEVLVLASGEGSPTQVLQRIGRGLRRGGGKDTVYIRDVVDNGHDYLEDASRRRTEVYHDEGFDVKIRRVW